MPDNSNPDATCRIDENLTNALLDYERLDTTLKGLHRFACAILMLRNLAQTVG